MTEEKLNELFQFARTSEPEISSKEISEWLAKAAVAAAATGGVALGYKLLLTKKMIIMTMSALTLVGIGVLSTGFFNETTKVLEQSFVKIELAGTVVNSNNLVVEDVAPSEIPWVQSVNNATPNSKLTEVKKLPLEKVVKFSTQLSSENSEPKNRLFPVDISAKKTDTLNETGREIPVQAFTELHVEGIFDVIIDQGESERVFVLNENGDEVIAENNGTSLVVTSGASGNKKSKCKENLVVHITIKDISKLVLSGIGNVTINNIKLNDLDLIVSGVGDVEVFCALTKLNLESSGVGNFSINGSGQQVLVDFSGVGDLNMKNFIVEDLILNSSGIGNNYVYASKSIAINGSGVGDIVYLGGAAVNSMSFSGIGNIKSKE